jgi:hypothetical protein
LFTCCHDNIFHKYRQLNAKWTVDNFLASRYRTGQMMDCKKLILSNLKQTIWHTHNVTLVTLNRNIPIPMFTMMNRFLFFFNLLHSNDNNLTENIQMNDVSALFKALRTMFWSMHSLKYFSTSPIPSILGSQKGERKSSIVLLLYSAV